MILTPAHLAVAGGGGTLRWWRDPSLATGMLLFNLALLSVPTITPAQPLMLAAVSVLTVHLCFA